MTEIERGARVEVRDVNERPVVRRALSGVVEGPRLPVVWVCPEDEWAAAQAEGREPEGVAWPAAKVQALG